MTIIKFIKVECSDCHWSADASDADDDFDKMVEMEDDDCPGCQEKLLRRL